MKLKSFIVATLIVSIVACSFVTAQAVAFYQKKDGEVIQLFPILLTYHQPEELESNQTKLISFSSDDWESWEKPSVNVTYRMNSKGNIEIKECDGFMLSDDEHADAFIETSKDISLSGSKVTVRLTGYWNLDGDKSEEKSYNFIVRFTAFRLQYPINGGTDIIIPEFSCLANTL